MARKAKKAQTGLTKIQIGCIVCGALYVAAAGVACASWMISSAIAG